MVTAPVELWTESGVRLRRRAERPGDLSWLFSPGGPGIGAESLYELIDAIDVPGTCWTVDLPGDGSNVDAPGAPDDPYELWPGVLLEAALVVPNPVYVGHSTGGMYLLSTPELESVLVGLALISTAPDARWLAEFAAMTRKNPLAAVDAATAAYEEEPTSARLRDLAVASAPWNFGPATVGQGAQLLGRMPYNPSAFAWSDEHFDSTYRCAWWPAVLPTLIVSGTDDRIVDQALWDDPRYRGDHVIRVAVSGGAHFRSGEVNLYLTVTVR